MQILIPDSWLREFIETDAKPKDIQRCFSLCGPSIERLHEKNKDFVYDIEVTTNRVDMMSVVGIARECLAILPRFGYRVKSKIPSNPTKVITSKTVDYLKVKIDKKLCQRFSAILIKNIQNGESDKIIQDRLGLCGLRPINKIVDVSNYLMLQNGQPVHTFDYDKINKSQINLRESIKGELITTLDHKKHILSGGDIVIEDESRELIDLCGIMGGLNSAVDSNTTNVLLFVQTYEKSHIRKTSMSLSHRTDAAVLFEKGLPTEGVLPTLAEGVKMLGGNPAKTAIDVLNVEEKSITLNFAKNIYKFVNERLGILLKTQEIKDILSDLNIKILSDKKVVIPWYRKDDITIPEDIVEEVARIYGYHNLPSLIMNGELPSVFYQNTFDWEQGIKQCLKYLGFTETYTYSLVNSDTGLRLRNPLSSEWEYLRTNLTNSHLRIVSDNLGRESELNFFEIANVYIPSTAGLPQEKLHLIITSTILNLPIFKGKISVLENLLGTTLDQNIQQHKDCLSYEIDLTEILTKATTIKKYTAISKFNPVIEDINTDYAGTYNEIVTKIRNLSHQIKDIEFIDKYGDKLTLRITFLDGNKQLTKEDISPVRAQIMAL